MEYDKLANEKTEMQRHYVMVRSSPPQGGGRAGQGRAGHLGLWVQQGPGQSQAQPQDSPLECSLFRLLLLLYLEEGPKQKQTRIPGHLCKELFICEGFPWGLVALDWLVTVRVG